MATAVALQPRHLPLGAGGDPRAAMCSASTSKIYTLEKVYGFRFMCRSAVDLRSQKLHSRISKRKCHLRSSPSEFEKVVYSARWLEFRRQRIAFQRTRRSVHTIPLASQDDGSGVSVNGAPQVDPASQMEEIRVKLDKALQKEDISTGLVQSIHDAARSIELAFLDNKSSMNSWFPKTWLGVDNNAWIKPLSYQAAVGSLLQAVIDVSSRGNGRDRDTNVFVRRSLSRLLSSLDGVIQNELAKREPSLYQWYSSNQNPLVVRTFVNTFETDPRFNSATTICCEGKPMDSSQSDLSLLILGLFCLAAITKLGSAKVSCQQFFSMVPDIIGRFMDMLLEFVPISKAYTLTKDIGLQREFLCNFGPRAAVPKFSNDHGLEISFWIDLLQNQLLRALDREKIWSRLTTSESIEVLEKDLAIFGFFIALGRSTQAYLSSKGLTDSNDSINGIVRYLIGGSVLYYPQLSSISSFQLYVEVVCEELEWLPFYYEDVPTPIVDTEGREEMLEGEVISRMLNMCSYWMSSFIKYSSWLENPSNVKAARFLSKGHAMLSDYMTELDIAKDNMPKDRSLPKPELLVAGTELASIDKSLESVEEALVQLEKLLQELHLSSSNSGKEDLKAACSDLEMIRRLKKEAEFLEAYFRAKAEYLEASAAKVDKRDMESNDIRRFEQLRRELIELERRVQKSAADSEKEENGVLDETIDAPVSSPLLSGPSGPVIKKESFITKTVEKVKDSTTIVLQGTQLLAIDTGAAMGLLKRSLIGDELTQKEKQALQRTLTDLASVVPIGFLMLLPVTAVGHAAMLAFIQRYVPSMIPSTYGPERLYLLRQLEKVKEMELSEGSSEDMSETISSRGDQVK